MNPNAAATVAVLSAALLVLPRRWAVMAFLAGTCYLGFGQGFAIGPFNFTTMRVLAAFGFLRVAVRRERLPGGMIGLDRLMILWAIWMCASSVFHEDPKGDLIFKLGTLYNACGIYFLFRVWLTSAADVAEAMRTTALVLIPVAAGMASEHLLMRNPFALIADVPETPMIRDGKIRSFGPFTHPILAGTAGAVALPLMAVLWRSRRRSAWLGGATCLSMVAFSGSSGPVMSALAGMLAVFFWPYRQWTRALRWASLAVYLVLDMVMKVPAYYIIARLDVTGSSTGWHRAALIESSIAHLNEWWLAGTDYTRHWMPTGVSWHPNHTDITNHYLHMGVLGGLPLTFLFLGSIVAGFVYVGRFVARKTGPRPRDRFAVWALGCALFAHAVTCISVSYFDQSVAFLYLTLAAIGSACHGPFPERGKRRAAELGSEPEEEEGGAAGLSNRLAPQTL